MTFTLEDVGSKQAFYNFVRQDPHNSQREGISVFYRNAHHQVFHTYSTYARGIDAMSTVPGSKPENQESIWNSAAQKCLNSLRSHI